MRTALVVPSNRKESIVPFLDKWSQQESWDKIIVVEDNPTKTFQISGCDHFSWHEIANLLPEKHWIFSKRDSAIRCFGFWMAYTCDAEYIFTLDDDCYPSCLNFIETHIENLILTSPWVETIPGVHTRGMPYNLDGSWSLSKVMFSMGLWRGVPDFDAVHALVDKRQNLELPKTRVMPSGQYFPFCGMNFACRNEAVPLCYFPLMGEGYPYCRFDDIWFGVICKKICDHLGWQVTCGKPYVNHSKVSDPLVNLEKEAPGLRQNEVMWRIIDLIYLKGDTVNECMFEIGEFFKVAAEDVLRILGSSNEFITYLRTLGQAMQVWVSLFANP